MADTTIATDSAHAVKRWDSAFTIEMGKKNFWAGVSGKDPNNICQTKLDLTRNQGDRVRLELFPNLSGAGFTGELTNVEGSEEETALDYDDVTVNLYGNAWRTAGPITEQRSPADLREQGRRVLSVWAGERVDALGFTAIESSPTTYWTEIADTLTKSGSTGSVTASDLIEPHMASALKASAHTQDPKIAPIKQAGRELYVLLMHTHCEYDMKNDSTWQAFHRDADVRDPKDNYIFRAGMGSIDNVLLYSHENVAIATDWGSGGNVNGAYNKFLGAQAMAWAWARYPWLVEKRFQYGLKWGCMVAFITGFKKISWSTGAQDFGLIELRTARSNLS
jgi:N4-gp56 family major capsid protein